MKIHSKGRSLIFAVNLVAFSIVPASALTFSVTSTTDAGSGSLRQAIVDANANTGVDTISFGIASGGLKTITLASALPNISDPLIIDGTTQGGFNGAPLIELTPFVDSKGRGVGENSSGLTLTAGGSEVRGLAINGFGEAGILLKGGSGNLVQGNHIGPNITNDPKKSNLSGIEIRGSSNNTIGGVTAQARNVISGNNIGILINTGSTGNVVQGNYVGTNYQGADGLSYVGNGVGVMIDDSPNNIIGGVMDGSRNVISGNAICGILLSGISATNNMVQGNYIGLQASGNFTLPNGSFGGIGICNSARFNIIGGTTAKSRNVISGNEQGPGIRISGVGTTANKVQGNYIGTNTKGIGYSANFSGIDIEEGASANTIGGTAIGAGNVISGNSRFGIFIFGVGTTNNQIEGNHIGTEAMGTYALSNGSAGIGIFDGAQTNTIGGATSSAANTIAFNTEDGVYMVDATSIGNAVRSNVIFGNGGLGINLFSDSDTEISKGVTANDLGDGDNGPNGLQNFPILNAATISSEKTTLTGTLSSIPNSTFIIDLYRNRPGIEAGYGTAAFGYTYLSSLTVSTDSSGSASFTRQFITSPTGDVYTATATLSTLGAGQSGGTVGDTSEFSSAIDNVPVATEGVIVSEFRFRGRGGSTDEYVEIYNTRNTPLNISGWKIRTNTGSGSSPVFQDSMVPADTIVPAHGHFLFTGSGYSVSAYSDLGSNYTNNPAQAVISIGADASDDSGVALFNAVGAVQDAVGFASSASSKTNPAETLREGAGLAAAPTSNGQYAFLRRFNGPVAADSSDSSVDFVLVSTDGAAVTSGATTIPAQLGSPNPESLSSPTLANTLLSVRLLDPLTNQNNAPNRVRTGSGSAGNLLIRRTLKNNSTQAISKLRLQVTLITSQNSPSITNNQADVRVIGQGTQTVSVQGTPVTVFGTVLEAPSNTTATTGTAPDTVVSSGGGGLGSSLSFDLVLPTPLQPGQERNYAFNLQVARSGNFVVVFNLLANTTPATPAN